MAFYEDLDRGHEGEKAILEKLRNYGYTVSDCSRNPEYFYAGDLLVLKPGEGVHYVEVKTSWTAHKYGSFYVESYSRYGKPGWLQNNEYEYIAFYDPVLDKAYFCSFGALKEQLDQQQELTNKWGDRYYSISTYKLKKIGLGVI